MKATGIVRKIDDLGRVVIPKEIRKNLHIHEGDPLEIYIEQKGEIILKKYAPMKDIMEMAGQYVETLNTTTDLIACITDTETIIAISGISKNEYIAKQISDEILEIMKERKIFATSNNTICVPLLLKENGEKYTSQIVAPIIADADVLGTIILFSLDNRKMTNVEHKLVETAAHFLAKQME